MPSIAGVFLNIMHHAGLRYDLNSNTINSMTIDVPDTRCRVKNHSKVNGKKKSNIDLWVDQA